MGKRELTKQTKDKLKEYLTLLGTDVDDLGGIKKYNIKELCEDEYMIHVKYTKVSQSLMITKWTSCTFGDTAAELYDLVKQHK